MEVKKGVFQRISSMNIESMAEPVLYHDNDHIQTKFKLASTFSLFSLSN